MSNNIRKCPSCKGETIINEKRDKHWDERLICAYCCAKAHNCNDCRASIQDW